MNIKCVHLQLCAYRTMCQSASLTAKLPFCTFAGAVQLCRNITGTWCEQQ